MNQRDRIYIWTAILILLIASIAAIAQDSTYPTKRPNFEPSPMDCRQYKGTIGLYVTAPGQKWNYRMTCWLLIKGAHFLIQVPPIPLETPTRWTLWVNDQGYDEFWQPPLPPWPEHYAVNSEWWGAGKTKEERDGNKGLQRANVPRTSDHENRSDRRTPSALRRRVRPHQHTRKANQ